MLTGTPIRRRAKRSEALQTRLTAEEHAALRRLSAQTGIAASRLSRKAIRELVTGGVDLLNREQQAVLELARQMRLIGVNLNQIARHLNRGDGASRSLAGTIMELRETLTESEYTWRRLVAAARGRTVPEHGRG
jgi:mobilization protein MobC